MAYDVLQIANEFAIDGVAVSGKICNNGHINQTIIVTTNKGTKYVLQSINSSVFGDIPGMMENINGVTSHIREAIKKQGGDANRGTLNFLQHKDGQIYVEKKRGEFWRCYKFVDDTITYQQIENPEHFYNAGLAFGQFQCYLADYPAEKLVEVIPDFHNTADRYIKLQTAILYDLADRADSVKEEIAFAEARRNDTGVLIKMLRNGELPIRVTHNDTKLNNVLLDAKTGKPVCVIDLDTVMPGLSLYDFGDSIRFGANPAAEDEKDLSKVYCDLELFEQFTKGYLERCGHMLCENEIKMLPFAAKLITLECGMRFLTDYLNGDTYFRVHYDGQNLDRCRTQFKLVADMEEKMNQMQKIVEKYSK